MLDEHVDIFNKLGATILSLLASAALLLKGNRRFNVIGVEAAVHLRDILIPENVTVSRGLIAAYFRSFKTPTIIPKIGRWKRTFCDFVITKEVVDDPRCVAYTRPTRIALLWR